jgi:hypothetical protein
VDPERQKLIDYLTQARKTEESAGIRLGAMSLVTRLAQAITERQGIKADLYLSAIGAIAGYTAQEAARRVLLAEHGPAALALTFNVVETNDGQRFFYSDIVNQILFDGQKSILSTAKLLAEVGGLKIGQLPDAEEIASHVAGTLGTPQFGQVRYPAGHGGAFPSPLECLVHFWPQWSGDLELFCPDPNHLPVLTAAAISAALADVQNVMPLRDALVIVMEAAVPMSKVDLQGILAAGA